MQNVLAARTFDRRLFLAAALLFPVVVVIGFGPTYYAKAWFGTPPLSSLVVHLHGLVMSLWVVLFVTQIALVSSHRVRVHQRLGWAGVVLGALIVGIGLITALRGGKYGFAAAPAGIPPLAFMIVPMFDLLMFIGFFTAAIYFRKRPSIHRPMMLLTAINFLPPAIARIRIASLQAMGPIWFFGLPAAIALLCVALDARARGRVNPPLLAGTLLLILSYAVRLTLMTSEPWRRFAVWATSFV
jgi:hypothetical protein